MHPTPSHEVRDGVVFNINKTRRLCLRVLFVLCNEILELAQMSVVLGEVTFASL
jgi:hypothetical protein